MMKARFILYEMKKWIRNAMTLFLFAYPIVFSVLVRFGVPYIEERFHVALAAWYHVILAGLMVLTTFATGALIGFSILDDRDDKVLYAIDVSPVSFDLYIGFRFAMGFVLSYISCILAVWIADVGGIPLYARFLVPIPIALFSGIPAMLINCFASNKVEGFAMMKASAMIIVFPIVSMFFTDNKEFFFGFEPNFWAVKALSTAMLPDFKFNLGFFGYYPVGLIYVVVLNGIVYKIFAKRITV